jgi:hypothetical protein
VTTLDASQDEISHRWPEFLPGRRTALFTIWKRRSGFRVRCSLWGPAAIVSFSREDRTRFSPTGHIVYAIDGKLMAVPFDLGRLELTGEPVRILELPHRARRERGEFSISGDGTLAYVPAVVPTGRTLLWVDRRGRANLLPEPLAFITVAVFSRRKASRLTIGAHNGPRLAL